MWRLCLRKPRFDHRGVAACGGPTIAAEPATSLLQSARASADATQLTISNNVTNGGDSS